MKETGMLHSTGATVVAQSDDAGPLTLVKEVIRSMPHGTRIQRFEQFLELLADYPDYQRTVNHYFFVNMHDYITTKRSAHSPTRQSSTEKREAVERIKTQVVALSLNFVMPSGKALRDSTGAECKKAGGWLAKIARKVGPRQTVGKVFADDAALRAVLR